MMIDASDDGTTLHSHVGRLNCRIHRLRESADLHRWKFELWWSSS